VKARIREAAVRQAETAKEVVMRRAVIVEGEVLKSTTTYRVLGALGGWLLGALIGKRVLSSLADGALANRRSASPAIGEQTTEAFTAAKERASEAVSTAKERASEAVSAAKERASEAVSSAREKIGGTFSHARERIPSAHDVSGKMDSFIHTSASNRPLLFALIPLCVGAVFALLLPVSASERRVFSSAKQKFNQRLSAWSEQVEDRIEGQRGSDGQQGTNQESGSMSDDALRSATAETHVH